MKIKQLAHAFFIRFHQVLGTLLSLVFLMWFISGLVMMYHYYPSASVQDNLEHMNALERLTRPMSEIISSQSLASSEEISTISYEMTGSEPKITIKTTDAKEHIITMDGTLHGSYNEEQLLKVASAWHKEPVRLVDTLCHIDKWLIGAMPFKEWPVYHFAFDNAEESELYLSSRTGLAVQHTNREERFWTYLGAFPHWIYITQLRATGRQPWTDVVIYLSAPGSLMILAGIILGIRSWILARRRRLMTPYVKPWFRWHHLLGLVFGLFVLTFVFSGYMSMRPVPQWMKKTYQVRNLQEDFNGTLRLDMFQLDAQKVIQSTPGIKRLTWTMIGPKAYYKVETTERTFLLDAGRDSLTPFEFNEQETRNLMEAVRGRDGEVTVTLLEDYDFYYVYIRNDYPLPVYRAEVSDPDGSTYYLNPKDGSLRYYNNNTKWRKWLYSGLHTFSIPFFKHHKGLRDTIFWVLMIGGCAVSVTGVYMGTRVLARRAKKLRKQR